MALPAAQERLIPSPEKAFGQDLLIGLSLANLCYLRIWSELLTYRRADTFWMMSAPTPASILSTAISVPLLGFVLAAAMQWARKKSNPAWTIWARRLFLISLALPLNAIRSVLSAHVAQLYFLRSPLFELIGTRGVMLLAIGLAVTGLAAAYFWYRPLSRAAAVGLRILFPFTILTMLQAAWAVVNYNPSPFAAQPAAPLPAEKKSQRLVWLLFDEMDQRLAFEASWRR